MNVADEIEELTAAIEYHNRLYYCAGRPMISDRRYDELYKRLESLEEKHPHLASENSPTKKVGGWEQTKHPKVKHDFKLLSLDNTYSRDEVMAWDERVKKAVDGKYSYVVEPKIDGLAVSLTYEDGILTLAATRGNGSTGDDVTDNVLTIKDIPIDVGDGFETLVVTGEVYMKRSVFDRLNKEKIEQGKKASANPRNYAVGTLKQLDVNEVRRRSLSFFPHNLMYVDDDGVVTQSKSLALFKKLGFSVNPYCKRFTNISSALDYIDEMDNVRRGFDYETDGMVIKVDEFLHRDTLGETHKYPRWAIAYKYESEKAETRINEITIQVGKGGVLTPVAELEPVHISGSTVKRATLHNFDFVQDMDIRVGDTILVQKAGEIIPQVVEVKKSKRSGNPRKFTLPTECPVCGSDVGREDGEVAIRCLGENCIAQLKRVIRHYVSKKAMDIEFVGEKLVDTLVDEGLVTDVVDLYLLDEDELSMLDKMGDRSIERMLTNIHESLNKPLDQFIVGLSIHLVGSTAAPILAEHFGSIDALMNASVEELMDVEGVGQGMAESIYDYFQSDDNVGRIMELKELGMKCLIEGVQKTKKVKNHPFSGKTFVLTGGLENYTRVEASKEIKARGGKTSSSVSSKTDFLLVGDKPGSKYDKGLKLGVEVLDEEAFCNML